MYILSIAVPPTQGNPLTEPGSISYVKPSNTGFYFGIAGEPNNGDRLPPITDPAESAYGDDLTLWFYSNSLLDNTSQFNRTIWINYDYYLNNSEQTIYEFWRQDSPYVTHEPAWQNTIFTFENNNFYLTQPPSEPFSSVGQFDINHLLTKIEINDPVKSTYAPKANWNVCNNGDKFTLQYIKPFDPKVETGGYKPAGGSTINTQIQIPEGDHRPILGIKLPFNGDWEPTTNYNYGICNTYLNPVVSKRYENNIKVQQEPVTDYEPTPNPDLKAFLIKYAQFENEINIHGPVS
jgi:hypothetical protein